MNPITVLTIAASAVTLVLVADNIWVSLGVWLTCALISAFTPTPRRGFSAALPMGLPAFIGFGLMYVPFGHEPGWWIITRDGLRTTVDLGARFLSATTAGLVICSFISVDSLMRALQPRVYSPLLYVLGSTTRLYPMASARWNDIRQIRITRGVEVDSVQAKAAMVLPLIVGLVDDAAQRSRALQRTGIGEPGRRTVLRPVRETWVDWLLRGLALGVLVVECGVAISCR